MSYVQETPTPEINTEEHNLNIIDNSTPDTFFKGRARPILNINWDLEKPTPSSTEVGFIGADAGAGAGAEKIPNTLVSGSFRRSEIDNIIGRNTSVFISNVTNELFTNGFNAANQISSQYPRPLLVRKRLLRIVDIWNRIIIGMNITARDNGSMTRLFGANIQTNADILFRNQQTVVDGGVTYNEVNSWTNLVYSDPAFTFSQIHRFLLACVFELKEKLKLLNSIVDQTIELDTLIENDIMSPATLAKFKALSWPLHITPTTSHPIFNWTVQPTSATSKFQNLGAFSKHIPQSYSLLLLEPTFLTLLQELLDAIMPMVEEEHFKDIFRNSLLNAGLSPKDLKLISIVKNINTEVKLNLDNLTLKGIEVNPEATFGKNILETSHLNFTKIDDFFLKYKNDYNFINEMNNYNFKKAKYRFLEDSNTWNIQRQLRLQWEEQKLAYEESIENDLEPVIGNLLVEYPLDVPNPENPESLPGPFIVGKVTVDGVVYQGPAQPVPTDASFNINPVENLLELRKYDFVDNQDYHEPYKELDSYKLPYNKNTLGIIENTNRLKNWVRLQKDSYTNLDSLLEVFEYCSDLTGSVRYRLWNHGKTIAAGATRYNTGNRIDRIVALNISKLNTYLSTTYFESLDKYRDNIINGIISEDSPKPVPFFKPKIFSCELYTGVSGVGVNTTVERNWKFGWSIVKFPKQFEISPNNIIEGTKYLPCSWIQSGTGEILLPRNYIDVNDPDDEMYFGLYNASTSFAVSSALEEQFRKMYPIYTKLENLHSSSLCSINTIKVQLSMNAFKLQFIGDNQDKYFKDSNGDYTPDNSFNIEKKTITEADIFINIKGDDDGDGDGEETLLKPTDKMGRVLPYIDILKNFKIFYRLN